MCCTRCSRAVAAFGRETLTDTLAAILEREPDWAALPPSTPHSVRRLLARCLEKDPRRRLRDIADAPMQLDVDPDSTRMAGPPPGHFRRLWWVAAPAAIVGLAALAVATTIVGPRTSLPPWATDPVIMSVDIPTVDDPRVEPTSSLR